MDNEIYDVIIVGGGMVGCAMARALSSLGLRVALLDKNAVDALYPLSQDNRGIALSWTSIQILKGMSLWALLEPHAYTLNKIHVSEQYRFGHVWLDCDEVKQPYLGAVVSAYHLGRILAQSVEKLQDVICCRNVEVTAITITEDEAVVCVQSVRDHAAQSLRCRLVIGADGTNSVVKQQCHIGSHYQDAKEKAIITNVHCQNNIQPIAYQRFTSYGPLAFLPFGQQRLKCIWTMKEQQADKLMALSDLEYLSMLQQVMGNRLGSLLSIGKRLCFSIQQVQTDTTVQERVVLVGNAANTLLPVAAQGLNLGLRDVAFLFEHLEQVLQSQQDIGSLSHLKQYAHARMSDHHIMGKYTRYLNQLFGETWAPVKSIRHFGLVALNLLPAAKNKVSQWGMGRLKKLPQLARKGQDYGLL